MVDCKWRWLINTNHATSWLAHTCCKWRWLFKCWWLGPALTLFFHGCINIVYWSSVGLFLIISFVCLFSGKLQTMQIIAGNLYFTLFHTRTFLDWNFFFFFSFFFKAPSPKIESTKTWGNRVIDRLLLLNCPDCLSNSFWILSWSSHQVPLSSLLTNSWVYQIIW